MKPVFQKEDFQIGLQKNSQSSFQNGSELDSVCAPGNSSVRITEIATQYLLSSRMSPSQAPPSQVSTPAMISTQY